jgi:hypothetical protein
MKYIDVFIGNKLYILVVTITFLYLLDFNQSQSSAWIAPYLSATANFDWLNIFSMQIDKDQIEQFTNSSQAGKFEFNFLASDTLENYNYLAIGFYFISVVATKIFFFLGDLEAIKLLQQIVHVGLSIVILSAISTNRNKFLFFIFYMINPIVLYFVNFPYYYFWQVVPAAIFLYYFISHKKVQNMIFAIAVIFAFIYLVRPTTLFFILFILLYFGYKESWRKSMIAMAIFFIMISVPPKLGFGPWHTMYVGVGAYANSYNIKLSDKSGYEYFEEKTGKIYNSSKVSDDTLKKEYYSVLKERYFSILNEEPLSIVKNALLNTVGSYGFGYKTGSSVLVYTNILVGFIMLLLLLYTKQYLLFFTIGISSATFTPYYPPIGAYMFGSYILIVIGLIGIIEYFINKRNCTNG